MIVQQKTPGQPASPRQGTAAWYNRKTGESQFVGPQDHPVRRRQVRRPPYPDGKAPDPPESPEAARPDQAPSRSYFERKGFNGR